MAKEDWHKGYKEAKNVIHNDIGFTKEEMREVFAQIAREEIKGIIEDNRPFIMKTMREVIQSEMMLAVREHRYPKIRGNLHIYGHNHKGEHSFQDYVSGVIKEEIVNHLQNQFKVDVKITENEKGEI